MKVHHIPCGPAVNESERKAIEQIKSRLINTPGDGEWILLTNLEFSASNLRQADEIDIVVIGPPGVQIIEVKHWSFNWVKRNKEIVRSEADRVTQKARRIGTTLRRSVENLPHVAGVFLVTESAARVSALESYDAVRGVSFKTLKTWEDAVGIYARTELSVDQIRAISGVLEPKSLVAVSGTLRRLAGYSRLELQTPSDQRFHRVYKAKHTSRQDSVLLHLYDLSTEDHPKTIDKAEREWRSLQRLQQFSWAPRIIDSFQDVPGYPGEIKFFTMADPAAPSIAARSLDDSWSPMSRVVFARATVNALAELHDSSEEGEATVHRNLTSETVLVKHDNSPILTSFEYTRIPLDVSIASSAVMRDFSPSLPPEILAQGRGAADLRSDIYSICASLSVLFTGRQDELSQKTSEILAMGMEDDPTARCDLSDLDALLLDITSDTVQNPSPLPARYWTEDQVISFGSSNYRIVTHLGAGGVGATFKVVKLDRETQGDLGTYVAKVVRDEDVGNKVLSAYELAHSHLRHSALSTIFEVASEWRDDSFVALMTWIEGEPLGEYSGLLSLLSEELYDPSAESLVVRWLQTACEALSVLHDNGLVHGDVSPRNMIVSGSDLVLTDYDCVTKVGLPAFSPGTVLYSSPSYLNGECAMPSDDLYALAASFFHVLFDREPFFHNGVQAKDRGLCWEKEEQNEYPILAKFMNCATHPDPEKRFKTVADALTTLTIQRSVEDRIETVVPNEQDCKSKSSEATSVKMSPTSTERTQNEVQWLRSLLQSYPGSRWGNSETRGLDTEFAENTYVETNLERALYEDIVERRVALVVLCGNAGDGKTALLQKLAKRLNLDVKTSATRILEGVVNDTLTIRMNLDGSASWNGRSADELLDEFLAPFQNGDISENKVYLLAINDGRLLEWVENVEERHGETTLTRNLSECLESNYSTAGSYIRFVNLNQRSLVGGITPNEQSIETEFLDRLIDELYGGTRAEEIWRPCRTCSAQDRCEVFRASRRFGPNPLSKESVRDSSRSRLFEALQAVHLRGETHITMRELRAALVYILFGVQYCNDYHEASKDLDTTTRIAYWDRAFSPRLAGRQGDVLGELPRFDPALEAQPQVDRRIRSIASTNDDREIHHVEGERTLESLRRRAYFEWDEDDVGCTIYDTPAPRLSNGRHLRAFMNLAINGELNEKTELTKSLCAGISRLEALPPQALDRIDVVPLRVASRTPTETAFWIEKPIRNFRLEADIPEESPGLDRLHRQAYLKYEYRDGRIETLRLGADLFHLLLELSEGYQLGDVAADDTFAHLSIFVQRLVQEDHRKMLAWNPMQEDSIFEVSARIDEVENTWSQHMVISPIESKKESDVS